jgi:hypothetical protein
MNNYKKLLSIIVLNLLWCNVSLAECIKGDCKNGQGTYTLANGTVKMGIWKNHELIEEQ